MFLRCCTSKTNLAGSSNVTFKTKAKLANIRCTAKMLVVYGQTSGTKQSNTSGTNCNGQYNHVTTTLLSKIIVVNCSTNVG
jgi:hypothetical protein